MYMWYYFMIKREKDTADGYLLSMERNKET